MKNNQKQAVMEAMDQKKPNILIVDERPENLTLLENLLGNSELKIIKATSGNQALELMLEYEFALVLLDEQISDMDRYQTAELIRENSLTKHVPILFITDNSTEKKHVFKGYRFGIVDYVFRPLYPDILKGKINVFIEMHKRKMALERMNAELQMTNKKIQEQQKTVIEEERLKVLLQMAGTTAHELNQPLMVLLGNIDLMKMDQCNPEKLDHHMERIAEAGKRISDIVKKMQTIRYDETRSYMGKSSIINIDQKIKLLSVEDEYNDYKKIRSIYDRNNQVELVRSKNIKEAFETLKQQKFDLILLDHILPDGDSFDFLAQKEEQGIEIPVVIVTGQGDEMIASQLIQKGAYDYLSKDRVSEESLSRSIMNTLEKCRLKREIVGAQKKMAEMSIRDDLTKLYNRRYFMEALEREFFKAKRYGNDLVLCMIDLDYFKNVNDTYGHPAGDMVLAEIGRLLKECVRQSDLICRYGGEEFAIILPSTTPEKARIVCERFRETVNQHPFEYNSSQLYVTVSIGIAAFNSSDPEPLNDFIVRADNALYQAKAGGRNRVVAGSISVHEGECSACIHLRGEKEVFQ